MQFAGSRLRSLRLERRLDQHTLAERARSYGVGVTQSQISRYENGQEPSGRNALALASALVVDVIELYEDDRDADSDDDEDSDAMEALTRALRRVISDELAVRKEIV